MATYTPRVQYLTVTDAISTLTYSAQPCSVIVTNIGSNPVWLRYDGTNVTAADAVDTDYLTADDSVSWNNVTLAATLKAICAAGLSSKLLVRYTAGKQVG